MYEDYHWNVKLGGKIGYVPSNDYVISDIHFRIIYRVLDNLRLSATGFYGNSVRDNYGYSSDGSGWILLGSVWLVTLFLYILLQCVSPLLPLLIMEFHLDHWMAGFLYALPVLMIALFSYPLGVVSDRIGLKFAVGCGATVAALSSLMRPWIWFSSRPIGQNTQRALQPYCVCTWIICGKDGVKRDKVWYFTYSISGTDAADGPDGVSFRRSWCSLRRQRFPFGSGKMWCHALHVGWRYAKMICIGTGYVLDHQQGGDRPARGRQRRAGPGATNDAGLQGGQTQWRGHLFQVHQRR